MDVDERGGLPRNEQRGLTTTTTAGYRCVVLDNLDNSSTEALKRVRELVKASTPTVAEDDLKFLECDLVDLEATKKAVASHAPYVGCIHFAGFKAVGESVSMPWAYYYNNIVGTLNLILAMEMVKCKQLVFSSSATVYGESQNMPLKETEPLSATNPYGQTKLQIEQILKDVGRAPNSGWRIALLRYFNPVGAHPSGRIGEDPQGIPNNLLPYVAQVAVGRRDKVNVFGGDYPTPDGTGVRDYIHVMDLARAHRAALDKITGESFPAGSVEPYNVGTGRGSSVLEVIAAFEKAAGKKIPYAVGPRRPGDVATNYCDPSKAKRELGFETRFTLEDACRDSWRWQTANPFGFKTKAEVDAAAAASSGGAAAQQRKAVVFHMASPSSPSGA